MEKNLLDNLKHKNLISRFEMYSQYFEYIERKREIKNPSISVIVISWRFHLNTLISFKILAKQRNQNFELIFVNNGGKRDEFKPLEEYIDTYIRLKENTGAYLARNIGAVFSKAPIILFLEDDGIADLDFVESHLLTHKIYDVISVRGICFPEKSLKIDEEYSHYFHGDGFFPMIATLEGNVSYKSNVFFEIGGWDDDIKFGHGGIELSIRLSKIEPDLCKQIYSPISIIYHDLLKDPIKKEAKLKKQNESLKRLMKKYPDWDKYMSKWTEMYKKEDYLKFQMSNFDEYHKFINLYRAIKNRNSSYFYYNMNTVSLCSGDKEMFKKLYMFSEIYQKAITIFGTGTYGKILYDELLKADIKVNGFYDNDSNKWGREIHEVAIKSPKEVSKDEIIIIASTWYEEISLQLEKVGLKAKENYYIYVLNPYRVIKTTS